VPIVCEVSVARRPASTSPAVRPLAPRLAALSNYGRQVARGHTRTHAARHTPAEYSVLRELYAGAPHERAVRVTMVSQSLHVKTRASTRLSGGSALGTTRRSLMASPHRGSSGCWIRSWTAREQKEKPLPLECSAGVRSNRNPRRGSVPEAMRLSLTALRRERTSTPDFSLACCALITVDDRGRDDTTCPP
jgi:hypothetical protein